jgi:hypothetical protein
MRSPELSVIPIIDCFIDFVSKKVNKRLPYNSGQNEITDIRFLYLYRYFFLIQTTLI